MDTLVFQNIIIAMVFGFAIGLQREMKILYENKKNDFGGARTFAMIGLVGYVSAWLNTYVPFFLLTTSLILGALLIAAYIINSSEAENGITTEISALATFFAAAMLVYEKATLAVFVAIVVLFVLNSKEKIAEYAKVIEKKDLSAAILFAMMTFVVLPILQDKPIDPWGYFNLHNIWLMVILVAGISFFGYIAVRLIGTRKGIGLTGLFGGLASSTAVTLSFGRQGKNNPTFSKNLSIGISLACSIMLVRVFFEMYVINPELANHLLIPVIVATIAGYCFIAYLIFTAKKETIIQETTFKNPFKLSEALMLGIIFGIVIALIKLANHTFGDSGVYIVSFIAGSADVDAVALSVTSFAQTGMSSITVLNSIVLAIIANSITKFAIVAFLGNKTIALYVGIYLVISLAFFIGFYRMVVL